MDAEPQGWNYFREGEVQQHVDQNLFFGRARSEKPVFRSEMS